MKIPFQKVRAFLANQVGNPNVSEGVFAELDSAITADEASVEALLAVTDNPNQTAEVGSDANKGTVGSVLPVAVVAPAAVAEVVAATVVAEVATQAVVASVANPAEVSLSEVLQRLTKLEADKVAVEAVNVQLASENAELRANASPKGVVATSENDGGNAKRLSQLDQKDADRIATIDRLTEKFPALMKDIQ